MGDHHFAIHLAERYALIDEKEKALDFIEHSIKGFFPPLFLMNDRLLANLRGEERFKKLIEIAKDIAKKLIEAQEGDV